MKSQIIVMERNSGEKITYILEVGNPSYRMVVSSPGSIGHVDGPMADFVVNFNSALNQGYVVTLGFPL